VTAHQQPEMVRAAAKRVKTLFVLWTISCGFYLSCATRSQLASTSVRSSGAGVSASPRVWPPFSARLGERLFLILENQNRVGIDYQTDGGLVERHFSTIVWRIKRVVYVFPNGRSTRSQPTWTVGYA